MTLARLAALVCLSAVLPALTSAADFEKHLPNDTDAVIVVNLRQVVASEAIQKYYVATIQEWLKEPGDTQKAIAAIGLDPLKDIDWLVLANGESLYKADKKIVGGKATVDYQASAFLLAEGRFDAAKIRTWAEKYAKDNPQVLKIHPAGKSQIYQLEIGRSIYAAPIAPNMLAFSLTREPIADALERAGGKSKAAPKFKEVLAAIPKLDPKRSINVFALGNMVFSKDIDVVKKGNKLFEQPVTLNLAGSGIDSVKGGLTISDGIKAEILVGVKDIATGKAVAESLQKDQSTSVELAFAAVFANKQMAPVLELLKSMKTSATGKTVTIQTEVSAEALEKALK